MLEQSSRPLKVALSVLCVVMLAVLVLVILGENGVLGKKTVITQPAVTTSQSQPQTVQPVPPTEVRRVLGTVEKVSGQEIMLKDFRKISSIVTAVSDQSERMFVTVDQSTIIERFTYKDATTIAKEQDAFVKNIQEIQRQNPSVPPTPPEPFTFEKITLSDIKIGDKVMASFGEDISNLATFTATKIEVRN
ncbi:MAG: hypothetical protein Q7S04_00115 [Candidatus Moranbacteria bacterium]|nr:hypothetical protein [Candidatus Moranbacteria bacterium]